MEHRMTYAIEAYGLEKSYRATPALRGLDLTVPAGTVLGVLGPNGAGKTTAVRILATLLTADRGQARVAGYDVATEAADVRTRIALTGQFAAIDERLSGRENLELFGALYHLRGADIRRRAGELLDRFELTEAAGRPAQTYSGGMRRRLDLAAALLPQPEILFLDEPTTGLDPRSRLEMWELIEELVSGGTTVLLTTQYLEEADRLADQIVVIDRGQAIARGTADELKAQIGGERLVVTVGPADDLTVAARALRTHGTGEATIDAEARLVGVPVVRTAGLVARAVRDLDDASIEIVDLEVRRPTLDDVFLTLAGRRAEPVSTDRATEVAA
jgi:ABC-2 type transport system ATP-binding protein